MNRREALAALVSLPQVATIATVPANTDDVLVVECDGHLSPAMIDRIQHTMLNIWPNRKIVVLDQGLRLRLAPK